MPSPTVRSALVARGIRTAALAPGLALVLGLVCAAPALPEDLSDERAPGLDLPALELTGSFVETPAREIYRAIADQADLSVTFDPELKDRPISVDLDGRDAEEALHHLALLSGHYLVPVDPRSLLVTQDTPQNRRTFEPVGIRHFPLRYADPSDVMTALRSLVEVRKISASRDPAQVTILDSYPRLDAAARIVEMLDRQPWEIRLELELLPVTPESIDGIAATGAEISRERSEQLRSEAPSLAVGVVGLVGDEPAEWKVFGDGRDAEHPTDSTEDRGRLVSLDVRGRLASEDPDVTLEMDLSVLSPAGNRTDSLRQSSTFRVAEGSVLALPILLRNDDRDARPEASVLLVKPRVVNRGEQAKSPFETIHVGTEANASFGNR